MQHQRNLRCFLCGPFPGYNQDKQFVNELEIRGSSRSPDILAVRQGNGSIHRLLESTM
jgi:hypothetical protein